MIVGDRRMLVEADDAHPRHSEASLLIEAPGVFLLAWSDFSHVDGPPPGTDGGSAAAKEWAHSRDNNPAVIRMMRSADGGVSWSEPWVAVGDDAGINVMQPSIVAEGDELVMTYSRRDAPTDAARVIVRSADRGATWSEPRPLVDSAGYLTAAHDRLVVLDDGRWVQPAHELEDDWMHTVLLTSDDRGRSWSRAATVGSDLGTPGHLSGAWEASVAERLDGTLLMAMRSASGSVLFSESADRGEHWTPATPSGLRAPSSPSMLRRIRGDVFVLLRNDSFDEGDVMLGARRPLVAHLSRDGGRTWGAATEVESHAPLGYHYVSCAVDGDALILTYSITDPATRRWSLAARTITLTETKDDDV